MDELFSLSISRGCHVLVLAQCPAAFAGRNGRRSKVAARQPGGLFGRDVRERIGGNGCSSALFTALHVIPARAAGKAVVTALLSAIRPDLWVSDMLGSHAAMVSCGRSA